MRFLTLQQDAEIISKYETHTSTVLAKAYGCSPVNIRRIWRVNGLSGKSNRSYYANFSYFKKIDTEDKAYFLGFIASDGCISEGYENQQKMLKISINKQDRDILVKFRRYIESNNPIRSIEGSEVSFKISSNELCNDLEKFNIIPRKTHTYTPVVLSDDMMPHFLRGYFDGDGTIHCEVKGKPEFPSSYGTGITCNLYTAKFIQDYLLSRGIKVDNLKQEKRSPTIYDLRIYTIENMYKFLNLLYGNSTVYLGRKYEKYLLYKKVYEDRCTKKL